jgi:TorA maturation chaperone TorD
MRNAFSIAEPIEEVPVTLSLKQLEARSQLASWISATIAGPNPLPFPDPETAGIDQFLKAGEAFPPDNDADDRMSKAESERIRLFVNGPGGVPAAPYGSWWLEGTLKGRSTEQALACYLREGLRVEAGTGPADYLPTEFEFLSFLLHHQRAARMTAAPDLEKQSCQREREFIETQMLTWVPGFCQAGHAATHDPFWNTLFELVSGFIETEAARLRG